MFILFLASAFALSFAPLMSNAPTTTVAVEDILLDTSTSTLTVKIQSDTDVKDTATGTYRVAIYAATDEETHLFEKTFTKDDLDKSVKPVEVTIDMADIPADLDKLYVDVLETLEDKDEESMLTGPRHAVEFLSVQSVALAVDTTNIKTTITLGGDLAATLTDSFKFIGDDFTPVKDATPDHTYTVTVETATLKAAESGIGYFLGDDLATTTLPFTVVPAKPKLQLHSKTHAKLDIAEPRAGVKIMLSVDGGTPAEITKDEGIYTIAYADLAEDCEIYFAVGEETISPEHEYTALTAVDAPTSAVWALATDQDDKTPKLKIAFGAEQANRKLLVDATAIDLSAAAPDAIEPAKLIGGAAYYIVADKDTNVPETLPLELGKATFTSAKAPKTDNKVKVTVSMSAGIYEQKPTGVLVHEKGETDMTKAKFYPFTWGTTAETVGEATADVDITFWKDIEDNDVESYVVGEDDDVEYVKLTTAFVVIGKKVPTCSVTVGEITFVPATSKLSVPLESNVTATTSNNAFELAIYDTATGGDELVTRVSVKALLDATKDKKADVTLTLADIPEDLNTLYVDIIEDPTDRAEFSIVKASRAAVEFLKVESVSFAKDDDDVKILMTLSGDLMATLTDSFKFLGEQFTPVKETTPDHTYSITVTTGQIEDAESGVGYFVGDDLATTTLPFTVLPPKPAPVLGLLSATLAKCTLTKIPTGLKVMLVSGDAEPKALTQPDGKDYVEIEYADLAKDCNIYYATSDGIVLSEETKIDKVVSFVAPTEAKLIVAAVADTDKTPSLEVTFAGEVPNRQLVVVQGEESTLLEIDATGAHVILGDQLVGDAAYYIVADGGVPKSEGKALAEATFTQAKEDEVEKKIKVTVTMTPGFYAVKPTGIFVHPTEVTTEEKSKFYEFTWDTTTAATATAQVDVTHFKDDTDKDIESYVVGVDADEEYVELSDKLVVIKKKEPVEPEPKDEGAFGKMVSIMALLLSLIVFAL